MTNIQVLEVAGPLDTVCIMLGSLGATVTQPPVNPQLLSLDDHHLRVTGDDPRLTAIEISGPSPDTFRAWLLNQLVDLLPHAVRIRPGAEPHDAEPSPAPA